MIFRWRSRIVGCRLRCVARHGAGARWDDDGRLGIARSDLAEHAVLIVSTVGSERSNRAIHLIEQSADLGGIADVAGGQRRRLDLSGVSIHGDVQLAPRPPCLRAVLLEQPLARAAEFQPCAVHQQLYGTGTWSGANYVQALGPAAQGGVVWHGQVETEQSDDGADQPFALTQRQAEHRPQRQRHRNGQGRVSRLAASRGAGLRLPRGDCRVGEPDRQAAALP